MRKTDWRRIAVWCVTVAASLLVAQAAVAADYEAVISRWSKTQHFVDDLGGSHLWMTVTYYSPEYIEALLEQEAEKNLWTKDEVEKYKYEMLKTLQLDEYIPIHIAFDNRGPTMHLSPFDRLLVMWIGGKKYSPVNYDKRFNFQLSGKMDGLVFFPRFDEKTGEALLAKSGTVRLVVDDKVSPITIGKKIEYLWDVKADTSDYLWTGAAAERLEADRLIKRLQNLNAEKAELEKQLQEKNDEIAKIEARLAELQSK